MTAKRGMAVLLGLLLLALCFAGLAPSVEAAGHTHDGGISFQAWNSTTTLPSASGAYYLTGDVKLTSCWKVPGNINLCLNGHTITQLEDGENVIEVSTGSELHLYNCTGTGKIKGNGTAASVLVKGNFYMENGSVEISGNSGACGVEVGKAGNFALNDGVIMNNLNTGYGGGVFLATSTSNMQMSGGVIYGNNADNGAGVAILNGSFFMYGGEISGNAANMKGGGVYVGSQGKFNMYGGCISGNGATSSGALGGGLYVEGEARFMNGGEVSGNDSGNKGGGISLVGGDLVIQGALIENNTAPLGGGIYATCSFTLRDATVRGNRGYDMGGGIYLTGGDVKVDGRVKVMNNCLGNSDSLTECNLCFQTNMRRVEAIGSLDGDSQIGVYLETPTNENSALAFTSGLKNVGGITDPNSIFEMDQRYDYGVTWNSGKTDALIIHLPKITKLPQNATATVGKTAAFTVEATGGGLRYQWEYSTDNGEDWVVWGGKTEASVTVTAAKSLDGRLYRVRVWNDVKEIVTVSAKLTVIYSPEITKQPQSIIAASDYVANFSVKAAGNGLSYQWQYSTDFGKTWQNSTMEGSKTETLPVKAITARNGLKYRCTVKNAAGSATTVAVQLTVKDVKPAIRVQPANQTVSLGNTVNFTVSAAGSSLAYQWQYSTDAGKTWQNSTMEGAKTATLPVKGIEARNGLYYRCIVKNSYGSTTSSSAKLSVVKKPVITAQPTSAAVALNNTVNFKVTASGTGLSYQWKYSTDAGKTWQNSTMEGAKTATLPVKGIAARNGLWYKCVVSNSSGSVTSNAAALTVTGVKPAIRRQPANQTVSLGNTVNFTVKAYGSGLAYQWQYSTDGGKTWQNSTMEGAKTATLPVKGIAARNGLYYRCVVKNSSGSVTSSSAKLTVK